MIYTDQLNRKIQLPHTPGRIISLVPSQTELLADLGLEDEVVGITKFCVHPEQWFREKPRVGGTKSFHLDRVRNLQPDLIIGNKEENDREQIEILMKEFPVWMSDIKNLSDAMDMIRALGIMCGKEKESKTILLVIQQGFKELATMRMGQRPVRAAYLIWQKPFMVAGGDTFIHSMMHRAGYKNIFGDQLRYPEIQLEDLINARPEVILLSSEPFPFKAKHIQFFQEHFPNTKVKLVDGEMFSWYGSRLQLSAPYFQSLL